MSTPKRMIAGQRRSLAAIEKKLQALAAEWGDVDAFNESELESLARKVAEVSRALVEE